MIWAILDFGWGKTGAKELIYKASFWWDRSLSDGGGSRGGREVRVEEHGKKKKKKKCITVNVSKTMSCELTGRAGRTGGEGRQKD